jgi:HK97 family phage prohead protease
MWGELERRSATEISTDGQKIVGHAVIFDTPSQDLGGFVEVIEARAVDRTLSERLDVVALADHDDAKVLGRVSAGTLRLAKDARGLRVEIDPPNTTIGRDLLESVRRGDIRGMSFSFRVVRPKGERFERRSGMPTRIISDMIIRDVTTHVFPAYTSTDLEVAQRSLQAFQAQHGQRIDWLAKRLDARV